MRTAGITALICILVLLFWDSFFVFPLKIFVVFLHELSHGIAAILTGGSIERIELSVMEGGVAYTRGGWRFVILSAGYLGSLLWGSFFLIVGTRTKWHRALVLAIGVMTLFVTLVYIRSLFGFFYGLVIGAGFLLAARKLPVRFSEILVLVIGIVSCLYAPWDIASDVFFRNIPGSDANALGQLTGIPGIVWGVVWTLIALFVVGLTLIAALHKPERVRV